MLDFTFKDVYLLLIYTSPNSLASVQEQRLPPNEPSVNEESLRSADISVPDKVSPSIDAH